MGNKKHVADRKQDYFSLETKEKCMNSSDIVINLELDDPTVFEEYWRKVGDNGSITITANQPLSYYSNTKNLCGFLEPDLSDEIKKLHELLGNAAADNSFIVVGNGSIQLLQAALYALSSSDAAEPFHVVSAVTYYSVSLICYNYLLQRTKFYVSLKSRWLVGCSRI
ncbi:hypothetical protein IFM89_017504 [Coptis chinensis]|uniref:Alliinase C-terminal domain-containing protein n=1 Tax=Coptis chinensis TaxID=261450 RepID=A0A835LS42_9MAGN|nr:hypothetical protein IFM89_017504 [Coptis chinensis]